MTIAIPKVSSLPELPSQETISQEEQPVEDVKTPSFEEIIFNHEQRILSLEAAFTRVRGAI